MKVDAGPAAESRNVPMSGDEAKAPRNRSVRLAPSHGSPLSGISKDKMVRITDAMADLQLVTDGVMSRSSAACDGNEFVQSLGGFARACSVFLRKTVLGDRRGRQTRLLDDHVLEATGLEFDRLRKIPRDNRRLIEAGLCFPGGITAWTKLDDRTREPREAYRFIASRQEVKLSIEWPLPGAADWTEVPSEAAPWYLAADQLFDTSADSGLSCDDWLGQQVVLFDGKGISLKELVQTVVIFEGAHSIGVNRLSMVEGEKPFEAAKKPHLHILNAITLFGIPYAHLIVFECGMYLYQKLLDGGSIQRPSGDTYSCKLGVACSPKQAESTQPDWVKYEGGMMISFSGAPRVIQHKIKAVT